jgi:glycosyltransferase involved in cell wall biosynthesis
MPERLAVALDCSAAAVSDPTGIAMVIHGISAALAARHELEVWRYARWSRLTRRRFLPQADGLRSWWFGGGLYWRGEIEVFHGLDSRLPRPRPASLRTVATIHDFSALQGQGFSRPSFSATRASHYEQAREAQAIVVHSQAMFKEAQQRLSPAPGQLKLVSLGASPRTATTEDLRALRERIGEAPFVLVLGEASKRKNSLGAVRAFAQAQASSPALASWRLVLAGREGYGLEAEFESEARKAGALSLGYVDAGLRAALLNECRALLFPSRYEGFGLPVLEAMALGRPVISSDIPALSELGGQASLRAEPDDIDGLAGHLRRLAEEPALAAELGRRGRARASGWTWERCAAGLSGIYFDLLENPR